MSICITRLVNLRMILLRSSSSKRPSQNRATAMRRNLVNLPQALTDLQATNLHVSPGHIGALLANDAGRRAR
jgi:hypothetical protein